VSWMGECSCRSMFGVTPGSPRVRELLPKKFHAIVKLYKTRTPTPTCDLEFHGRDPSSQEIGARNHAKNSRGRASAEPTFGLIIKLDT
jgi:hypothetical protein